MADDLNLTPAVREVLRTLLDEHGNDRERHAAQVAHTAGLPSGTVRSVLTRLEAQGLAESRMEGEGQRNAGVPWARLYRLTPDGVKRAEELPPTTGL